MKIGILTLPQETNYGGILQAFALQRTLRDLGHEAITIDRHWPRGYSSLAIHIGSFLSRQIKHYLLHRPVSTKWIPYLTDEEYAIVSQNTQQFIDRNILMTRRVFSHQLPEIESEYQFDAYVVGSDQVWLDYYCPNSFLDFVKRPNVKRVTYAASCGKKSFFNDEEKVLQCKELARQFDGISVREEGLMEKCKVSLGIDVQWVLDPTMLLNIEDYLSVVTPSQDQEPIVFSYILDHTNTKQELISKVTSLLKLESIEGNLQKTYVKDGETKIDECIYPSVDEWINNIHRAKFVVTDSFHGTVFSILFNKPFIAVGNPKRGMERFVSLLKMFGLEDRLVIDAHPLDVDMIMKKEIDYKKVEIILAIKRQEAFEFLTKSLA